MKVICGNPTLVDLIVDVVKTNDEQHNAICDEIIKRLIKYCDLTNKAYQQNIKEQCLCGVKTIIDDENNNFKINTYTPNSYNSQSSVFTFNLKSLIILFPTQDTVSTYAISILHGITQMPIDILQNHICIKVNSINYNVLNQQPIIMPIYEPSDFIDTSATSNKVKSVDEECDENKKDNIMSDNSK